MDKEQRTIQGTKEEEAKVSKTGDNTPQNEQITREPFEIDQQEGNMNNGELGGNFTTTDSEQK